MGYWFDGSVTDLEITNMALSKIGHNKITSMSEMDDISLTHIFNQTRDMLQARYSWAFCRHRKVLYPSPVELLNSLKSNLNAHAADTTMHSNADTVNFPITDADITSMEDIVALANKLRVAYKAHYDDAALMAGWAYHVSTESIDHSLSIVTSPATQEEAILIIFPLIIWVYQKNTILHQAGILLLRAIEYYLTMPFLILNTTEERLPTLPIQGFFLNV